MPRTSFPKSPVGKPRKHPTAKHFQYAVDEYFESCWESNWVKETHPETKEEHVVEKRKQIEPYIITGLALHLGMSREALLYYQDIDEEYLSIVKEAKLKCQAYCEGRLFSGGQVAGPIFNLKANYGYTEKSVVEHQMPGGLDITTNDNIAKQNRNKLLAEVNS